MPGTKRRTHDVRLGPHSQMSKRTLHVPASLPDPIPSPFEPEPRSESEPEPEKDHASRIPPGGRYLHPESPTETAVHHPPAHLLPQEYAPVGPIPRSAAFTRGGALWWRLLQVRVRPASKKRAEIERARGPLTQPYPNPTRGASSPVLSNPPAFHGSHSPSQDIFK